MKQCSRCKRVLSETKFRKDKHTKDGLYPQCRDCKNEYDRKRYRKNRDTILAQKREYNRQNKVKINARTRNYYQKNREKILAYHREYRNQNSEEIKKKRKEYRKRNKEKRTAYQREYCQQNKEKVRAKGRIAYLKRRAIYPFVMELCVICGKVSDLCHHPDYRVWNCIYFLCFRHHGFVERELIKND